MTWRTWSGKRRVNRLNREQKAEVVEELHTKFANAKIAVVTDYRGMTVPVMDQLRKALRGKGGEYRVAKNTLLRRAVEGTPYTTLGDHFKGTTAVAVSSGDAVASAKVLADFSKDNPQFQVKMAAMSGKLLDMADLKALAALPPKEVLLAKLLAVMNAVPTNFVRVLGGVPRQFVYALQAVRDKKEESAG